MTEPDAQALYAIRNQLEHRYLKVHEIYSPPANPTAADRMWIDDLAYSIQREDFEAKTLREPVSMTGLCAGANGLASKSPT